MSLCLFFVVKYLAEIIRILAQSVQKKMSKKNVTPINNTYLEMEAILSEERKGGLLQSLRMSTGINSITVRCRNKDIVQAAKKDCPYIRRKLRSSETGNGIPSIRQSFSASNAASVSCFISRMLGTPINTGGFAILCILKTLLIVE